MKSNNSRRRLLALFAGGLLATFVASQSIAAKKPVQVVTGVYTGEAVSTVIEDPMAPPPAPVPVALTLENAKNRKLLGFVLADGEGPTDLKGTISASGQVSLDGKLPEGPKLILKGKFTVDPDSGDRTIEGTYKITKGGDEGTFLLTAPAPPAP